MNDAQAPAPRTLDPAALKALAHPLRVEIFDQLASFGPATASMLAHRLDESSGATSYHLRQIAKHGLVREAEGKGTARERWWEVTPGGLHVGIEEDLDPAAREASKLIGRQWWDNRARRVDEFLRRGDGELAMEWVEGSGIQAGHLTITAAELKELSDELQAAASAVMAKYRGRKDHPLGARPVQVLLAAHPLMTIPEELS